MISLVEYARDRGIRVMMEIDTPSHARSWCSPNMKLFVGMDSMALNPNRCSGYPDLCPPLPCADGPMRTPLDPSSNSTFDSVQSVFSEVALLLPEVLLHTGQDEVHTCCRSLPESENLTIWPG